MTEISKRTFAAGLLLAAMAFDRVASAQDLSISAQVDKNRVSLDDQVTLTVMVSGAVANLPEPKLPGLPNFNVHSAGRSQNISFINGQISSQLQFTYVLEPRFVGKAVIGPIVVEAGGKSVQTNPMELAVARPSDAAAVQTPKELGPPPSPNAPRTQSREQPSGPDLFVTADVDNQKPYVNEQVILTVRFFTTVVLLNNPQWAPPSTSGFLIEDLPPGPRMQATRGARTYVVSEAKIALFPTQPGRLTIGSSAIHCQVQTQAAVDPSDFFQRFFASGMMGAQTKTLQTKPLVLDVAPLPETGKPASFSGAVGRYGIQAEVDKKNVKAGDAVNLTVTLQGTGNIKTVGQPKYPEMPNFRVYETLNSLNLDKSSNGVRGTKIFKTVLVPKVSGTLAIASIPFDYFDPEKKRYEHIQTNSITLEVGAGTPQTAVNYLAPGGATAGITALTEDIRFIHEKLDEPLLERALAYWAALGWIHGIPLALFLFSWAMTAYREQLSKDPAGLRRRRAFSQAQRKIKEAQSLSASDSQKAAALLAESLAGYLADKFHCPASSLTLKQIQETLQQRFPQVAETSRERLRSVWEELEQLRFAPASQGAASFEQSRLSTALGELLQILEREM